MKWSKSTTKLTNSSIYATIDNTRVSLRRRRRRNICVLFIPYTTHRTLPLLFWLIFTWCFVPMWHFSWSLASPRPPRFLLNPKPSKLHGRYMLSMRMRSNIVYRQYIRSTQQWSDFLKCSELYEERANVQKRREREGNGGNKFHSINRCLNWANFKKTYLLVVNCYRVRQYRLGEGWWECEDSLLDQLASSLLWVFEFFLQSICNHKSHILVCSSIPRFLRRRGKLFRQVWISELWLWMKGIPSKSSNFLATSLQIS